MCLEQLYPAFDYQGGLGWSRFYLSGDSFALPSVCVSLSWVNGGKDMLGLGLCLETCSGPWTLVGLVVILRVVGGEG